ncbi:MAG: PAS domain S-box protein [Candidatus Thorarchaeota archaeon]
MNLPPEYNREAIRNKFEDLFKHSLDLIYINDLNGNFLDANEVTLVTLGYQRDEIANLTFIDLLDREGLIKAYKVTKEIRKTGKQSYPSEYKVKTKNGELLYIETYGIPLKQEGRVYAILGIGKNITELRKTELKLKESEKVFKALFKEGPIPAYIWRNVNNDFILIDYNEAADRFTHGVIKSLLGIKASIMYSHHLDIIEDLTVCMSKKTQLTKEMEYQFQYTNESKYLTVNYGYIDPDLIIVRTEDITEKKEAENKLKDSELKYRKMVGNLDVGFYQVTLDGRMLNHNPAHNLILNYDISESLVGKNVSEFWQNPEQRQLYVEQLMQDKYAKNYICPALTKNGKKIVVQLNSHLIYDAKGNPIGVEGTFIDITEKYNLEKKLRESERKYRNLYENTPFSIILINSNGFILDLNPTFETMFGFTKNEVIGKTFMDLPLIHPDFLSIIPTLFDKFLKGEQLHRIDIKVCKKNGSVFWTNLQAALLYIGEEVYVQALLSDITPRKEAEFLIEQELKKLKDLDQIRKNLISRVSHELKTPLVSVNGGCELLITLHKEHLKSDELEIIELIEKGGKRLSYLVESLTDISRIEFNKFELLKKNHNLSEIIREIAKELMYSIKGRKLNLSLMLPDDLIIFVDRIRIEQVIMNLLSNAIKNTPPDGDITVSLIKNSDYAIISVSDTGIGLTENEMSILFTRFGKIERYGEGFEYINVQGSGLGLYISKEIVDLHEGVIQAESEGRNKGSKFIVKLPL